MDGPKFGLGPPVCNELYFVCRVGIAEKEIVVDVVKKYLEKLGASATVDHVDVRKGGFH